MNVIDRDALIFELTKLIRTSTGEYKHGLETARLAVRLMPTAAANNTWISVEDGLPEEDKEVLAYNGAYMFIAAYTTNPTKYWYTISGSAMRIVTHWMPLPEAPEEGGITL